MTGQQAMHQCQNAVVTVTQTDGTELSYTAVMYGAAPYGTGAYQAPFEEMPPLDPAQPINIPSVWIPQPSAAPNAGDWSVTTFPNEDTEEPAEFFEMVTQKEIRQLLSDIFLWTSGMGEYPELLAQIAPIDIVGDAQCDDPEERAMVAEKMVAQVLRWALGEI